MSFKIFAMTAAIGLTLSGCATTPMTASNFSENRESVSVVLMKPDIKVMFDTVGSTDLRVDWTEESEVNLKAAIVAHLEGSGETVVEFDTSMSSPEELDQLTALNEQVSTAMGQHAKNVGNVAFIGQLPHKKENPNQLDYSLGTLIAPVKDTTDADYAAFVTYRSVVESGGSIFTKIAVGALTGYAPAGSDFRGTMINLVDLNTGEVVWLNARLSGGMFAGDARNPDNATKTVNIIMDKGPFVESDK